MTNHRLEPLTDRVFWYSPDNRVTRPVLGAVAGERGTLLIDTGNSPAHLGEFLAALAEHQVPPPLYAVLTHAHWDHDFGTSAMEAMVIAGRETADHIAVNAEYEWTDAALDDRVAQGIEHPAVRDALKAAIPDRDGLQIVLPELSFENRLILDLGAVTCEIAHVGGDHAADSTVVYIEKEGVLFLSDCLYPGFPDGGWCYTPEKLYPLLDRVLGYDAQFYVEGHSDTVNSRGAMERWSQTLRGIGDLVERGERDKATLAARLQELAGRTVSETTAGIIVESFLGGFGQGKG